MTKAQKRKRHIELSWRIIEYKLMYYNPEMIDLAHHELLTIDDHTYDALEAEYLQLCLDLGMKNTVVHKLQEGTEGLLAELSEDAMMEPDLTRPSVQLVLKKYGVKADPL